MKFDVRRCAGPSEVLASPINTSPFLVNYTIPTFSPQLPPLHPFRLFAFLGLVSAPLCGNYSKMRWCFALLLCCFLAAVNALSSSGSRLLVVLDDTKEKSLYSTFWSDLEGNEPFATVSYFLHSQLPQHEDTMCPSNLPRATSCPSSKTARELTTTF